MGEWKDKALVLRLGHFREHDIWLRALFRERGIATMFAFGGARSRRRFCGCLDQLNTLACRVKPSRAGEHWNLEEAELLAAPSRLRADWRRMGIAANCARFAEACGIGPESAPEGFALLEDLRAALEAAPEPPRLAPLFFRLRLASILGFAPELGACSECGAEIAEWGYLQASEGRMLCPACLLRESPSERRKGMRLERGAVGLLEMARLERPSRWSADWASDQDLRQAGRAIDWLTQHHLGLEWDNGAFRRI